MMDQSIFSVSDLNFYVKNLLESNVVLTDLWIKGELSNVKVYANGGQVYFTLSDGVSQLSGVMYDSFAAKLGLKLENGLQVVVRGKIKVFHKKGSYVLQAAYMSLEGAGAISKEFAILKAQLEKEGLFDVERKKSVPMYPEKVGLITAVNSAAMWDFVSIIRHQARPIAVYVIPAVMQGQACSYSVMEALDLAAAFGELDAVFIARGGGSAEDLAGFNQEALVRRVARCAFPVVSAVGHEVDYTLLDYVADVRYSTPSVAAQSIAMPYVRLMDYLTGLVRSIPQGLARRVESDRLRVVGALQDIGVIITQYLSQQSQKIDYFLVRLDQANPLHKMKQGYSITRLFGTTDVVKSVQQISPGLMIETQVGDGRFVSEVKAS